MSASADLYQQVILEHNRKPRNFRKIAPATHSAEGFNPICGDHLWVYLTLGDDGRITDASFEGAGCAISKASASLMTDAVKGRTRAEAQELFKEFHELLTRQRDPDKDPGKLGKLRVFAGIWQYPARVKCAALAWHALSGALDSKDSVSTE